MKINKNSSATGNNKVIIITGASRGFGKLWAEAFLQRGDKVAATARNLEHLNDLVEKYPESILPIKLDVNSREESFLAIEKVKNHFGRIDVLINNAGFGLFGAVEETTEQQAKEQMETNFFGLLWATQAVLPIMRKQQYGHIIQVSSMLGLITLPFMGLYNASKFAVEGLTESLVAEVAGFGINLSLVEPNGFSTDWAGASAIKTDQSAVYTISKEAFFNSLAPESWGKPEATKEAILKLVDAQNPPLRLLLGNVAYPLVKQNYEKRFAEFEEWKNVSEAAQG